MISAILRARPDIQGKYGSSASSDRVTARAHDVRRHGAANISWISANLERFSPCHKGSISERGLKAFSELAFVYGLLAGRFELERRTGLPVDRHFPEWLTFIRRELLNPRFAVAPRSRPSSSYYLLLAYLMLRSTGFRDAFNEETLTLLGTWNLPAAVEVLPHRLMDRHFVYWKAGLEPEPEWEALYQLCTLSRMNRIAYMDRSSAYSVTHTLMYLTDLGYQRSALPDSEIERITEVLDCMIVHCWRMQDWDLLGELLVNRYSIDASGGPIAKAAMQRFMGVASEDGAVRPGLPQKHRSTKDRFWSCYHTTLVSLLLCATVLR